MTKQEINHVYEKSVYEIRLEVAMRLISVAGVTQERALEEADRFVLLLGEEEYNSLINRYR
jgi:hypothetical protein